MRYRIKKALFPFQLVWKYPAIVLTALVLAVTAWLMIPEMLIDVHRWQYEPPAKGVFIYNPTARPTMEGPVWVRVVPAGKGKGHDES
jgi:hypothetical protein